MQEVYDFLKKVHTFFVATVDGDQPRVRPFGALTIFEGKLYTQTGKKKNVFKQLAANPKVEICAFDGSTWLRIQCKLINDDRIEAKKYMLDQNPGLRRMYDENDDNTAVLYFDECEATFSSFTAEPRTIRF